MRYSSMTIRRRTHGTILFRFGLGLALPIFLSLLYMTGAEAEEKAYVGGVIAMNSCINTCVDEAAEKQTSNPQTNCPRYCKCALEYKFPSPAEQATKAPSYGTSDNSPRASSKRGEKILKDWGERQTRQAEMCAVEIWPNAPHPPERLAAYAKSQADQRQAEADKKAADASLSSKIDQAKQKDGSAGLYGQQIRMLSDADWRQRPGASAELRRLMGDLRNNGQKVLSCSYGPVRDIKGAAAYPEYHFWFRTLPGNMADLRRADPKGALRVLGGDAQVACPASEQAARTASGSVYTWPSAPTGKAGPLNLPSAESGNSGSSGNKRDPYANDKRASTYPDPSTVQTAKPTDALAAVAAKQRRCAGIATRISKLRSDMPNRPASIARALEHAETVYAKECS